MDVINKEQELAIKRFKKIEKLGNKLWIAESSRNMLNDLLQTRESV